MEDLLSVTQPMSKNVGQLFPEFSPCNGTTGSTLLYSMDRKELFEAPAYIKARPVCWHVKKGGKNHKLDAYSSEIRGLCSMKCSIKTLQKGNRTFSFKLIQKPLF